MSKRALVIDDDPMIRTLLKGLLEADGYVLVMAENGEMGLAILDSEPRPLDFAFIVLDVMMPGMSGFDVLARLKLHNHTSSIPVMMLTGEDRTEDLMTGYSTGADLYVTKPFTRQQL